MEGTRHKSHLADNTPPSPGRLYPYFALHVATTTHPAGILQAQTASL